VLNPTHTAPIPAAVGGAVPGGMFLAGAEGFWLSKGFLTVSLMLKATDLASPFCPRRVASGDRQQLLRGCVSRPAGHSPAPLLPHPRPHPCVWPLAPPPSEPGARCPPCAQLCPPQRCPPRTALRAQPGSPQDERDAPSTAPARERLRQGGDGHRGVTVPAIAGLAEAAGGSRAASLRLAEKK